MEEQKYAMSRMRQLSQERDQKLVQTIENAIEIAEQKRLRVQKKMETNEYRVQKQRELMSEHVGIRKHINMLKQLKKDWNMRRQERRDEYLKALSELKFKQEEEKLNKFLKVKRRMVRSRSEINRAIELQQFQIKEALHNMAITKKWNAQVIEQLAAGSTDLSGSTGNTGRNSTRPRTAGA